MTSVAKSLAFLTFGDHDSASGLYVHNGGLRTMFKNCQKWVLLACVLFLFACAAEEEAEKPEAMADATADAAADATADAVAGAPAVARTVISEGLAVPESVVYDQNRDVYLVSNINGSPSEADNNGYILVVDPANDNEAKRWASGGENGVTLNAPKGMALSNGVLWVADIDTMRRFYSATGKPFGRPIPIPGSAFLNDVCAAPDGSVIVSDSGFNPDFSDSMSDAIYRVFPDGTVKPVVASPDLRHPNGVFCESDGNVLVVNFHSDAELYRVTRRGEKTPLSNLPKGNLDGIEKDDDGSLYISSWGLGGVYRIEQGKEAEVVVDGVDSPADFALDKNRDVMVLPSFDKNELHIIPLPGS